MPSAQWLNASCDGRRPGRTRREAMLSPRILRSRRITESACKASSAKDRFNSATTARHTAGSWHSDNQKAQAALALTKHECVPPTLTSVERFAQDNWRAEVLDRVETRNLPELTKNRLHLRKAGVWASLAFQRARRPELGQAAVQAAATTPGQPGETCIHLLDAKHDISKPLLTRCTYGIVWTASATANREGSALALAVQPLDTWREMWVFRQGPEGGSVDVVPPGMDSPNPGYIEFAGWVPGNAQMLAAWKIKTEGRYKQSFETLRMTDLAVERWADKPGSLTAFYRWQDPSWKGQTVSLR